MHHPTGHSLATHKTTLAPTACGRSFRPCLLALAVWLLACGPRAHGADVRFAKATDDLDPTGLKLAVKSAELDGRADGSVVLHGKPVLVFSKREARVPADDPKAEGPTIFSVSGDDVEGNGKHGSFSADNDTLTFDGLTIAIRDGAPVVLISGHRIDTKLKFEVLPARAKRAALLLTLFILAISSQLDQRDAANAPK